MTAFSCFLSAIISFASGSKSERGMGWRSWKRSTPGGWVSITFIMNKDTSIKTGGQRRRLLGRVLIRWRLHCRIVVRRGNGATIKFKLGYCRSLGVCAGSIPLSDSRFQHAQLPLRFHITRPEPQGFLVLADCLFRQVLGEQGIAQVEMRFRHAG